MSAQWNISCPECDFEGAEHDFYMSDVGECFCPECDCQFVIAFDEDEDLEDDEDGGFRDDIGM